MSQSPTRSAENIVDVSSDEDEFAQWVQCVECQKWRELWDNECIYTINRLTWTCSQRAQYSCTEVEYRGKWWNSKCTYQEYQPGDLIAVKLDGFPWWPCIVDPNPVDDLYFHITPRPHEKRYVTSYHVTFLSNPVQRSWCIEFQVLTCNKCPRLYLPRDKRENQESVFTMYSDALKLSKEERLERYSFLKRCSVNIARSLERERRIFANSYNPKPSATRLQPKNQSKRNKAPKSSVKVKKTGTGASSDASSAQNSQSSRVTFLNDESSSESSDSGSDIEEIVATLATEPFEITSINNQSKTALCKNAPKKSKKELSIENAGTFLGRKTTTKCKPVVALGKEFTSVSDLEKIVDTVVQSSVEKLEDLDKSKLCERDERTSNKTEEDEVSAVFGAHDEGVSSSAIKGGVSESVIIGKEPEHDSSSGFDEDQTKSSTSNSEISVKSYKADEVSLNANRILSQTPSEDAVSSIEIDAIVLESESSKSSRQNQVKNKNQIIIAQEKSHEALETIQETQLEPVERDSLATEEKSMIDKPGPLILPSAKNNKPLKRRTNVLSSNSIISSGGAFKKPSFKMPRFTKAASQSEESRSSQENEKSEKTCLSVPTKLNVSVSQTQSSSQVSSDSSAFQKAPLLDKSEALPDELVSTLDDLLSQSQEILSQVSSQEKSQNARSTSKSGSQQDLIRDIDELITSQESLVGSVSEKHHEKLACEE